MPNRSASGCTTGETSPKPATGTAASSPRAAGESPVSAPMSGSTGPTAVMTGRRLAATRTMPGEQQARAQRAAVGGGKAHRPAPASAVPRPGQAPGRRRRRGLPGAGRCSRPVCPASRPPSPCRSRQVAVASKRREGEREMTDQLTTHQARQDELLGGAAHRPLHRRRLAPRHERQAVRRREPRHRRGAHHRGRRRTRGRHGRARRRPPRPGGLGPHRPARARGDPAPGLRGHHRPAPTTSPCS